MLTNDSLHTVENIAVLRVIRQLIVDELSLYSFLWGYDKYSLRGTSSETAQKVVSLVTLCENVCLHEGVGTEPNVVLGNGEEKEGAVSTVETEDAALTESLLNSSYHT
jgi:hypothetical protein